MTKAFRLCYVRKALIFLKKLSLKPEISDLTETAIHKVFTV